MPKEKLPSIHIYPGDWYKDEIAGCSLAAQGLWLRLMFIMHEAEPYGYLKLTVDLAKEDALPLARRCGCTIDEFFALFLELVKSGVPSKSQDGRYHSRRMIRDDEIRKIRMKSGKKGGRPSSQNAVESKVVTKTQSKMEAKAKQNHEDESEDEDKVVVVVKERELTDVQKVVKGWKIVSGFEKDESWDKLYFSRCAKSAKDLLDYIGDWERSVDCMEDVFKTLTKKNLTCTIETCVKHAAQWKAQTANGGRYGF